jgi:hypothetical protein
MGTTSNSSQRMVGDFPPRSRVTGVSLLAAPRITSRPASAEPVNRRWSKGSAEKSCARIPGRIAMVSSGNTIMARLRAARTLVRGLTVRSRGDAEATDREVELARSVAAHSGRAARVNVPTQGMVSPARFALPMVRGPASSLHDAQPERAGLAPT